MLEEVKKDLETGAEVQKEPKPKKKKAKSDNLRKAKENKNDEFYTQIEDIVQEIAQHKDYIKHFEGKTVFCNCDDPEWSAFVEFFRKFFKKLKLKKMIATHYNKDGSPSYKLEWYGEKINGDTVNMIKTPLKGNGDFRSEECIELLKEADIVVTNPPFSLFREYVAQLEEYQKKFVILGSMNAIAYKEFFPSLKDAKVFIGYNTGSKKFRVANDFNNTSTFVENGIKYAKFGNICWYTNLDLDKVHEPLILTKNYKGNEDKYPKYDNYDAIECGKIADIPKDYFPCWYDCPNASNCQYAKSEGKDKNTSCQKDCNGIMGVPLTFLSDYCYEQFTIKGYSEAGNDSCLKFYKNMHLVQPLNGGDKANSKSARYAPMLPFSPKLNENYYTADNANCKMKKVYTRIFIQRKPIPEEEK